MIIEAEQTEGRGGAPQIRPRSVHFFRVMYDVEKTRTKILTIARKLSEQAGWSESERDKFNWLGNRLREGR